MKISRLLKWILQPDRIIQGKIYYDPQVGQFFQLREILRYNYLCSHYCNYFEDTKATIYTMDVSGEVLSRSTLVLAVDKFSLANFDGIGWRVNQILMKEIVINRCYGGFGLSIQAQKMYTKKKGKMLFFYEQTKHKYRDEEDEFIKVDDESKGLFAYSIFINLGAKTNFMPEKSDDWFYYRDISRDDPDLVAVVKKLGKGANGDCAELAIIKIPDDVEWAIEEYDGIEWVAEKHRIWN